MADIQCRYCRGRIGFGYSAPLPPCVICPKCGRKNDTGELSQVIGDLARMREQAQAHSIVAAMKKAGLNAGEISAKIGIRESRVRPFLIGSSTLTDDEFRVVSEALNLPVPFRSLTTSKDSHGQT